MLEFLEGDDLKECFTFSVPPESEELQFPQRVTETKTFGGSVFDDYGNDSYRITCHRMIRISSCSSSSSIRNTQKQTKII